MPVLSYPFGWPSRSHERLRFRPFALLAFVSFLTGPMLPAAVPGMLSGDGHYLALLENGTLYSWGRNDAGQLGYGGNVSSGWGNLTAPGKVASPPGGQWLKVAAGDNHSLAIATDSGSGETGADDGSPKASLPPPTLTCLAARSGWGLRPTGCALRLVTIMEWR